MVNHPNFAGSIITSVFSKRFLWTIIAGITALFATIFAAGIAIGSSF